MFNTSKYIEQRGVLFNVLLYVLNIVKDVPIVQWPGCSINDSEGILRICKDLLVRVTEILETTKKIPRMSWGDAGISWCDFQRYCER